MRPGKEARRHSSPRRNRQPGGSSSRLEPARPPSRARSSNLSPSAASLLDDFSPAFDDLDIDYSDPIPSPNANPRRSFPHSVKQQCWDKAEKISGRDPGRWRRDPLGNVVFRKLVGCPGCLCHDYDHILPYSKASCVALCK